MATIYVSFLAYTATKHSGRRVNRREYFCEAPLRKNPTRAMANKAIDLLRTQTARQLNREYPDGTVYPILSNVIYPQLHCEVCGKPDNTDCNKADRRHVKCRAITEKKLAAQFNRIFA